MFTLPYRTLMHYNGIQPWPDRLTGSLEAGNAGAQRQILAEVMP